MELYNISIIESEIIFEQALSFFHKGKEATLDLEFYDDYGVTTGEFQLPAGATLYADSANPVYDLDTTWIVGTIANDTFAVADMGEYTDVVGLQIDTMMYYPDAVLGSQNFDDNENLALPGDGAWLWLDATGNWNNWEAALSTDEAWSSPASLMLPGDPGWGGGEGYFDVVDDTNFIWEFMYKGKLYAQLFLGTATKYNLVDDLDGIVPADAEADTFSITWELDSKYWTKFRYEFRSGSWLADSSITSPASVAFEVFGTYTEGDVGYIDDLMVAMGRDTVPDIIDTNYVVVEIDTTWVPDIDTLSTTYNQMGARFVLPAAAEWTEFKLNWTNPSTDIGGTLTMMLNNEATATPAWITQANSTFDDGHAGWTFFDDFIYGESTVGIFKRSVMKQDLHVYPNPAVDALYLSLDIPLRTVEIFNTSGQKVMMLQNPERILNVSELGSGLYMIHAYDTEGVVHVVKFIKK